MDVSAGPERDGAIPVQFQLVRPMRALGEPVGTEEQHRWNEGSFGVRAGHVISLAATALSRQANAWNTWDRWLTGRKWKCESGRASRSFGIWERDWEDAGGE